jgi:hypothetical protein
MGNIRARALYEATTPETVVRPTAASPDREVAQWINQGQVRGEAILLGDAARRRDGSSTSGDTSRTHNKRISTEQRRNVID